MQSGFSVPVSLSELSRHLNTDADTVRYWVKLLDIDTTKAGKLRCVSPEGARELEKVAALVASGSSPGDAVRAVKSNPGDLVPIEPEHTDNFIREDLDQIKKSLVLLSEVVKRSLDENQAIRAENELLRRDLAAIRAAVLPIPASCRPVEAWRPPALKDPLDGAGAITRLVTWLFHPERMRRIALNG